jgi:type I restriction enzyme R subunit
MVAIHSERTFEDAIEAHLLAGGYLKGAKADYDLTLALDRAQALAFVRDTQPKEWARLVAVHGAAVEDKFIARLAKELDARGTLDVLRRGVTDYGVKVAMAYSRPATTLAPATLELYAKNRLSVTRQLCYSPKHHNELDLALFVNGLPVVTVELKTPLTGQTVKNAMAQYRADRDPRDLLLQPRKRALVHFAVDPDEVYMTTRLAGERTTFLPFNKGRGTGAGNPDNPVGYKTAYLWEEVWQRDSLLDLLARFLHVEKGDAVGSAGDTVIFPRYHQLDVVRTIEAHATSKGTGQTYLIQHSAGSGKSNSIAWLAHRLSTLHNADDKPVFDTVIVITDRRVLDKQLQDTIFQFEHKQGVVEKIDQDSAQLAAALVAGRRIIITTLQKFPFVLDKVTGLAGKHFGVIIDEAHSSQTGESAKDLKAVLTGPGVDERAPLEAAARSDEAAATAESDAEDEIARTIAARGRQANLSFFAFTATPKKKTLELFGTPGADGKPKPFHLYAMRQAIEERFILDVLKHYITYKIFYKLEKASRDDPTVDAGKAGAAIARFVSLHPYNIAQKTEVIVEHFRRFTRHKIGGRAKAMVVTRSRLHAVRYKQACDAYITAKGYTDIRTLVAFSGKVIDEAKAEYTEAGMNGFGEKALPERFGTDEYQVLIVAEKYQTGFDEPLLHTMYVDKKLDGVRAVQTLSRLNRTYPGKDDTLVLDFVNEPADIQAAFRPYYEETVIDEPTDPNVLYDLKAKLDGTGIYDEAEVEAFAVAFFTPATLRSPAIQKGLFAALDPAVARYKGLKKEDAREEFKSMLMSFTRLYAFLAQIITFGDPALEKLYAYGRFLLTRLPARGEGGEGDLDLDDSVELEYYRLRKVSEGSIAYTDDNALVTGPTEVGTGDEHDVLMAPLSAVVALLNKRFGTEFTDADRLVFDQIEEELVAKEDIVDQARANTLENFGLGAIDGAFTTAVIDRRAQNEDIFVRLLGDEEFAAIVKAYMVKKVYERINRTT